VLRFLRAGCALLPAAALLAGCDSSPLGPESPARLVAVSALQQTILAGADTAVTLEVRVEDGGGGPVAGVDVRFLSTAGGGIVFPPTNTTDAAGIARGLFAPDVTAAEARVRVDLPGHNQVSAISFQVRVLPAGVVQVSIVGGDRQLAEKGSQLPLPLSVRIVPNGQASAAGTPVVWEIEQGTAGARLTADTTYADQAGVTSTLLTLGAKIGPHLVRAFAAEPLASDTAVFHATAASSIALGVHIDSIRPAPLREGDTASVFGSGFGSDPAAADVWVDGARAVILSAGAGRLQIQVPDFSGSCLPARRVGVRAVAATLMSNGVFADLEPRDSVLDLAPGEVRKLSGAAAGCVQFAATGERRKYVTLVQSASVQSGAAGGGGLTASSGFGAHGSVGAAAATPLRLIERFGADVSGQLPGAAVVLGARPAPASAGALGARGDLELRLRGAVRREIRRLGLHRRRTRGPAPYLGVRGGPGGLRGIGGGPVAVGDTLPFSYAVDAAALTVSCTDTAVAIRARVRGVGQHILLVEDVNTPAGGFSNADWDQLFQEYDTQTAPTDAAFFGDPADVDHDGRITVLFTPEVNRLSAPGSNIGIGGFFLALDLLDSGDPARDGVPIEGGMTCPTSNEGEIVYVLAPDPGGQFSDPVSREGAIRNGRAIVAHEIQHLLSAEQRLVFAGVDLDQLETAWLGEGLSHIAEEAVGLTLAGLPNGADLRLEDFPGELDPTGLFRSYQFPNFGRLRFFLNDPESTPAIAAVDPLGAQGLQMRGFAWIFLRWLADQFAAGDGRALFRMLSSGGPGSAVGVANVEAATGQRWEDLISDFALALAADNLSSGGLGVRQQVPSWNLREMYRSLQAKTSRPDIFPPEGYPLRESTLPLRSAAFEFSVGPSTARYFRLDMPPRSAALSLEITDLSGGAPSPAADVRVLIGRLQ